MLLRGACEDLLFLVGLVGYTILRKVEGSFLYSEEVFTGHQGDFHEKGMAGKEIRIRLPGIPDGPDMDLEGPPGKGAYRRTASAGQSRQEEPSGTWWWRGAHHGIHQAAVGGTISFPAPGAADATSALQAFEDRQAVKLDRVEEQVASQGARMDGVEGQVRDLAERLSMLESRPAAGVLPGQTGKRPWSLAGGPGIPDGRSCCSSCSRLCKGWNSPLTLTTLRSARGLGAPLPCATSANGMERRRMGYGGEWSMWCRRLTPAVW